jgi:hypothetical protein
MNNKFNFNPYDLFKANPRITLQEEADRWGLLYDPEKDFSMGINRETVFLWKQLTYPTTIHNISRNISHHFQGVPVEIEKEVAQLVKGFIDIGFVQREVPHECHR